MRIHRLRRAGALLVALALVACGGGGGGSTTPPIAGSGATAGPPPIPVIPEVASVNGVASLTLTAQFDLDARPSFYYDGVEVAPTIRVSPGDTIKIHFVNNLPAFCGPGIATDSNLHFHGFTSSPNQPGDDVVDTLTAPGSTYDYTVHVNPDQPPGLYWYHAHPHGLSSWEVGNGMGGAIVIEGIANYVPSTAGLRERVIVLRDIPNDSSLAAGESAHARRLLAARRSPQDDDGGGNACAPETDATPMVNGLPQVSIGIRPGETELFRVVNMSGHRHFDLSLNGQPMTIVAQDGVPIGEYPGAPQTISATDIVVPPAGRVEFLVTGTAGPTPLISRCFQSGPVGDTDPQVTLGQLVNDATWTNPDNTTTQTRVRKPFATLRRSQYYATAMPPPSAEHTVVFSEDANGFYINGQAYSTTAVPMIVSQHGTTEEWTLENDTQEVHDFHIHQVHFVVESVNGLAPTNPHWMDTIVLPPEGVGVQGQLVPSVTKVLLDFRDPIIVGTFVFHCHILDHEDGGMMAKIQVQ
jgi:FtsP/CotA-like multicopper oxidase with cupredoxin domain